MPTYNDFWMKRAIWIAKKQIESNSTPIASILIYKNFELGLGYNLKKFNYYPLAHAEIIALKQSSFYSSNRLIKQSTLYVTLKPCFVCITSLKLFKIKNIIYGINNPNTYTSYRYIKKTLSKIRNHTLQNECKNLTKIFYSQKN